MNYNSFIALDVGNSAIKIGLFEGQTINFFYLNKDALESFESSFENFKYCFFSSVNGANFNTFKNRHFNKLDVRFIRIDHRFPFSYKIKVNNPEKIGSDRLCLLEGALSIAFEKKLSFDFLLAIDFGTATTINFLSGDKEFLGGLIFPGLTTMIKSLSKETENLPLVELDQYDRLIGDETNKSIASGVLNASLGAIERSINFIEKNYHTKNIAVFITGGNSHKILKHLDLQNCYYHEYINLLGIKILAERILNERNKANIF